MRLVSPLLKHVVYPGLAMTGYLRHHAGAGPAVVTYHGVLPAGYEVLDPALDGSLVTAQSLRQQLQLLKTRYNIISPEEFLLWCEAKQKLPPCAVMLTCDDGLRNALTDLLPLLQEFELPCLFFVTGAALNQTSSMLWYEELYLMFLAGPDSTDLELSEIGWRVRLTGREEKRLAWWDLVQKLSAYDASARLRFLERIRVQLGLADDWRTAYLESAALGRRFFMINADELRQLAAAGMSIGAHTLSHPMLSRQAAELAWHEILASRQLLEQALGRPVWALAYPFGHPGSVIRRDLELAEKAGFKCAFTNAGGGLGAATPRFAVPRVHVSAEMSLAEFEAHVSGFYRAIRVRWFGAAQDISAVQCG